LKSRLDAEGVRGEQGTGPQCWIGEKSRRGISNEIELIGGRKSEDDQGRQDFRPHYQEEKKRDRGASSNLRQ